MLLDHILINVRQTSGGDLAAIVERGNLEHGSNFYFLIFSASWGRIEKHVYNENIYPHNLVYCSPHRGCTNMHDTSLERKLI